MARKRRWGSLSAEEKKKIRAEIAKDKACSITPQSLSKQYALAEQSLGVVLYHERVKQGLIEKTPDGKSPRYKSRAAKRWRPARVEQSEANGEATANLPPTSQQPSDPMVVEELTREELLLRNSHLAELLDEANRRISVLKTANRGLLGTLQSVMEC